MDKFRLHVLSVASFISFLIFYSVFILTVIYEHCWTYDHFWFELNVPHTPYNWFLLVFSLIICWWMAELSLTIFKSKFNLYFVCMHSILFLFYMSVAACLYNLNISYGVTLGRSNISELINYSPYLAYEIDEVDVAVYNKNGDIVSIPRFGTDHWRDFRNSNTCDLDIDFTMLDRNEWQKLQKKYELLLRSEYETVGLDYDDPTKYSREHEEKEK